MSMVIRVLRGLGRSLFRIGSFLALIAIIAGLALSIALPLWYFSNSFPQGYSLFVILLLSLALLAVLIGRLIRLSREPGALRVYVNRSVLPILKTVALVIASIAVIYGTAILISRRQTVAAILCALLWVLLLGFLKYGRRNKS